MAPHAETDFTELISGLGIRSFKELSGSNAHQDGGLLFRREGDLRGPCTSQPMCDRSSQESLAKPSVFVLYVPQENHTGRCTRAI